MFLLFKRNLELKILFNMFQSMTDVKLMSVERSEGVTLYINKESVDNVRVVTNNASQVNVVVPRSDPENKDETIMVRPRPIKTIREPSS